jgi:hypothetical protein
MLQSTIGTLLTIHNKIYVQTIVLQLTRDSLLKGTMSRDVVFILEIYTNISVCGEPAISLHSYTVPLVKWSTILLPVMRDPGSIGILLSALSRYTGNPDVIDHCGLV